MQNFAPSSILAPQSLQNFAGAAGCCAGVGCLSPIILLSEVGGAVFLAELFLLSSRAEIIITIARTMPPAIQNIRTEFSAPVLTVANASLFAHEQASITVSRTDMAAAAVLYAFIIDIFPFPTFVVQFFAVGFCLDFKLSLLNLLRNGKY